MAIGFTAFVLGGYWWYWETHFDHFQPRNNRLFAIITYGLVNNPDGGEAGLNQLHKDDAAYFKENIPEIEKFCFTGLVYFILNKEKQIDTYVGLTVDSTFFQMFYHRFLDGGYRGAPDENSVILTRKMAMKFFGTVHCAGEWVNLGDGQPKNFYVAGVIEDYPKNSEFRFDLLQYTSKVYNPRHRTATYVLLNEKVDVGKVKQKIAAHKSVAVDPYGIDTPDLWKFELCSMADIHLTCHQRLGNRFRNIRILAWAGWLVLVSALMNHLVLFVGYQQKKEREFVTRVSLGSTRLKLVVKMYIELLLPLCLAFIGSLCLIELLFPLYCDYTSVQEEGLYRFFVNEMNRKELFGKMSEYMFFCTLGFGIIAGIPIGFILRGQQRKMTERQNTVQSPLFFRRVLIMGQIFIGALFFMASLSMYKQLYFLRHKDLGIDVGQVMQISLGYATVADMDINRLQQELKASPWIEELTMTSEPIFSPHGVDYGGEIGFIRVEGRDYDRFKEDGGKDLLFNIQENFFDFFRIRFKEGKGISEENPRDYVINESGERELGFPDLLQRPLVDMGGRKIAGIIRDYQYTPLQYPVKKVFFYVDRRDYGLGMQYHYLYVRYTPGHDEEVFQYINSVMGKYDRGEIQKGQQVIQLSEVIEEFNRPEVVIFMLFSVLAALCILVSSFGIFSLVTLTAEQRKKEIAVRKVNGATFRNILFLFLKEYLWLVGIGGGMALLLGYRLMQNWLETYANHTRLGGILFVGVAILITAVVYIAVAVQVKKAMTANPAEALKEGD